VFVHVLLVWVLLVWVLLVWLRSCRCIPHDEIQA
jgi:hypothetical protein